MKRGINIVVSVLLIISMLTCNLPALAAEGLTTLGAVKTPGELWTVALNGDYAYCLDRAAGLRILDITDEKAPKDITPDNSDYKGGGGIDARVGTAVHDGFLYAFFREASDTAEQGMRKFDIKNPEEPKLMATYNSAVNRDLGFYENYAYVADAGNGIKIFDISQNTNSAPAATISGNYNTLCVDGNFLFTADTSGMVKIFNIKNPETPVQIAARSFTGIDINYIKVSGKRLYLGCGRGGTADPSPMDQLIIVDIANMTTFIANATYVYGGYKIFGLDISENYLYVTLYPNSIVIFDISDPLNVVKLETLGLSGIIRSAHYRDDILYVPARDGGLQFIKVDKDSFGKGEVLKAGEVAAIELAATPTPVPTIPAGEKREYTGKTFSDIEKHWGKADIEAIADRGIASGVDGENFAPDNSITRAEFLTLVVRAIKLNPVIYADSYSDINENDWYAKTVQIAADFGLIDNAMTPSGKFSPNQPINREEMTGIIVNAYNYINGEEAPEGSVEGYEDKEKISEWAEYYVGAANDLGFVKGKTETAFEPKSGATRAESAAIIKRALAKLDPKLTGRGWQQPPLAFHISDDIEPGESFTMYGEGIFPEDMEIAIAPVKSTKILSEPPENAKILEIFTNDPEGQFVTVDYPEDMDGGSHYVWIKNSYGWGKPIILNGIRPLWITSEEISTGNIIKVVGRNMDGVQFGAKTNTKVRLEADGKTYPAEVIRINPFMAEFTISENIPEGHYVVSASNDDIIWKPLDYGQLLEVVPKGDDPYNLGVSWSREFFWDNKFNVKDYGAKGDESVDDTAAVQAAIDAAKADGGGIAYVPDGVYNIVRLEIPAYVLLVGESQENTILKMKSKEQVGHFIGTKGDGKTVGRTGLINIKLGFDSENPDQLVPDMFIHLGADWGDAVYVEDREPEKIVLKNVSLDYPMEKRAGLRGIGTNIMCKRYFLMKDCDFRGFCAGSISTYPGEYMDFTDNYFLMNESQIAVGCSRGNVERNHLEFQPIYKDGDLFNRRGFDIDGGYLEANLIENCSTFRNEGEIINFEANQGWTKMFGDILYATGKSVTIEPAYYDDRLQGFNEMPSSPTDTWDINRRRWDRWNIQIIEGKGLGQSRELIYNDNVTYNLNKEWDIVPDETSKFVILMPIKGGVMYQNEVHNSGKGFWCYMNSYDNVMVENISIDTEGVNVNNYIVWRPETRNTRITTNMFTRLEGNIQKGVSAVSKVGGIGIQFSTEGNIRVGYQTYGIDIKDNSVESTLPAPAIVDFSEAPNINGIYVVYNGRYTGELSSDKDFMKAIIVENNFVKNSDRGLTIGSRANPIDPAWSKGGSSYGILVKDNKFDNVLETIIDDTKNTLFVNNN